MTKKKALKRTFVAEIDLKATFAELVPAKKKGRVPRHVGQGRSSKHVRLHGITADELKEVAPVGPRHTEKETQNELKDIVSKSRKELLKEYMQKIAVLCEDLPPFLEVTVTIR